MAVEFGLVADEDDLIAVQRLRYDVYVEEMGWFADTADHEARRLIDPEDTHSWLFFARDAGEVVCSVRITWGGDGFSDRQVAQYQLDPFLRELPAQMLGVGERTMIRSAYRGTSLIGELLTVAGPVQEEHGVRLMFGCCEPHLFNLYVGAGQRPYAERNISSHELGYLIPLVGFVPTGDPRPDFPIIDRMLDAPSTVVSAALLGDDAYATEVAGELAALRDRAPSPFDDLSVEDAARCTARSSIITCVANDLLIRRGGAARSIYVVLDGAFEVRDGDRVVAQLGPGEMLGEMAFLLEQPRALDVVAVSPQARVLCLSGGALARLLQDAPAAAAALYRSLATVLSRRLLAANRA